MERQQVRKPMRRGRESPEMQMMQDLEDMSPESDRYDGRGGGKPGGRVRSVSRSIEEGEEGGPAPGPGGPMPPMDRRPPPAERDERPQQFQQNYNRQAPPNFQGGFQRKEPDCLRITNFPSHVSDTAIRDALFHEFKKFGEVNVRVVFSQSKNERVAYVRFRLSDQARDAMNARGDRLTLFASPLHIIAIVNKTNPNYPQIEFQGQGRGRGGMQGKNFGRPDMGGGRGRGNFHNQYDNRRNFGGNTGGFQPGGMGRDRDRLRDAMYLPEDDPKATRTVFCGNLEEGVSENEIRRQFERYGVVQEIDIKYPPNGQGNPFAFVKFENLDMAYRAIISMSGQYIGRNQCKTGYGKQSPTNCLWVGGLGPWITLGVLEREFDRFGAIRKIDYVKGESYGYVQYETVEAAQAAANHMRGVPLGGPDKRLRVDFAEGPGPYVPKPKQYRQPYHQPSSQPDNGRGYNRNRYNQDRDFGNDFSPPPFRDGPEPWQGSSRGGGYEGDSRGNKYNRGDSWNRRDADQAGRMMPRGDTRRKRPGSPDEFPRDDWSPGNGRMTKRRRSPGMESRDWSPDPRRNRAESPHGRDWAASPDGRMRYQHGFGSDLSDTEEFEGPPVEPRRRKHKKRHRIPDNVDTLQELMRYLSMLWRGHLVLKNSAFSTRMFLIGGDANISETLLPHGLGNDESALRITQRLRLDQPKLEEVAKRISQAGSSGHAILLAMPGTSDDSKTLPSGTQPRALLNLVTYLQQKQAAGVISLPVSGEQNKDNVGVLHAFPPCDFSHGYLQAIAPGLGPEPLKEDHLVVIIVKGAA